MQIRDRITGLTDHSWGSDLWISVSGLTLGQFLFCVGTLLFLIPVLSLWVDSLKWIFLMHSSLTQGAAMKLAWRQLPIVCYSMLGSLVVPGRLSEFAGRCSFYPLNQHPRVMASTLMASSTQWLWVLALPALWILGYSAMSSDVTEGPVSFQVTFRGLPDTFWRGLTNPVWGGIMLGLAAGAAMLWWRIFKQLQVHGWSTSALMQVYGWSFIRYGILVLQWFLWLTYASITTDAWIVLGAISCMLALQWFMPLGLFMDLGFKGALSLWIWGDVLRHSEDALVIPLMLWVTNLVIPALMGGMWWLFIGQKFKAV